ncbi:MAG: hypothetical protein JSW39_22230 [Desulfobacterales bacterium]|nr:MAG: hypothetical protein JSW39_22230 [Desulfobacterales bacterium]
MDLPTKLTALGQVFHLYDQFAATLDVACKIDCADCCTANVTLTTLEGYRIIDHLISSGNLGIIQKIRAAPPRNRFHPQITTNRLAALCAEGRTPPDEGHAAWGPCPLLTSSQCPLYMVRPFGCRCFVSRRDCGEIGFAEMDDFVLTVNTVFLQTIEHMDARGCSGNFADILQVMASGANRRAYAHDTLNCSANRLIPNHPLKILIIPPQHRAKIAPILQALRRIKVPGGSSA